MSGQSQSAQAVTVTDTDTISSYLCARTRPTQKLSRGKSLPLTRTSTATSWVCRRQAGIKIAAARVGVIHIGIVTTRWWCEDWRCIWRLRWHAIVCKEEGDGVGCWLFQRSDHGHWGKERLFIICIKVLVRQIEMGETKEWLGWGLTKKKEGKRWR